MKKTLIMLTITLLACVMTAPLFADAALFKAKCAACHGADGSGDTAMGKKNNLRPLGSAEVQKLTDDELTAVIASGKDGKPAHAFKKKGLTDDQVKSLVAFIRTLKK